MTQDNPKKPEGKFSEVTRKSKEKRAAMEKQKQSPAEITEKPEVDRERVE